MSFRKEHPTARRMSTVATAAVAAILFSATPSSGLLTSPTAPASADRLRAPAVFKKDFTRPMSIPEEGIEAAIEVMRSGRLNRYTAVSADTSQVSLAEKEFAEAMDAGYAVATNSCSSGILVALLSVGIKPGDKVLSNSFTFISIPSMIVRIGANPVLVECCDRWTIDLDDLEKKAAESKAKFLLLSHMRGKIVDMDRVAEICDKYGMTLVEDCAHACGIKWRGRQLGYHAKAASFSMQSDKVVNAGEGGFMITSDENVAARALFVAGAYEFRWGKHLSKPSDELCEAALKAMPNLSLRMSELTAAVLRPLLRTLPERVEQYQRRHQMCVDVMAQEAPGLIEVPKQDDRVSFIGDHLNFRLLGPSEEQNLAFQAKCKEVGVPLNWLRSPTNARWHVNWRGFGVPATDLPKTDDALATAFDLKLPPHFEDDDFVHIANNIAYAARVTVGKEAPAAV